MNTIAVLVQICNYVRTLVSWHFTKMPPLDKKDAPARYFMCYTSEYTGKAALPGPITQEAVQECQGCDISQVSLLILVDLLNTSLDTSRRVIRVTHC